MAALGASVPGLGAEAAAGGASVVPLNASAGAPTLADGAPPQTQGGADARAGEARVKGKQLVVPVAFGTVAFWMGKKADEYHSHRWTVYLRSARGQDLSSVVKNVTFHLHPSFPQAVRTIETPPFEVTETGWGEFEIQITVHFADDAQCAPLELFHTLKLYPQEEGQAQSTKKPVVVEGYEEVVFHEPLQAFFDRVSGAFASGGSAAPPSAAGIDAWFPPHNDAMEIAKFTDARASVAKHVEDLRGMLAASGGAAAAAAGV